MILPTIVLASGTFSGLLATTVTPALPIVTHKPQISPVSVNTLLGVDGVSFLNTWENSHTCGWYAGTSSSAYSCGSLLACTENTETFVACTWADTPGTLFTACMNKDDCLDGKCSSKDAKAVYCGDGGVNTECSRYSWTSSSIRSRSTCSTINTTITLRGEPFYIAAKSTSSSTASGSSTTHEPTPTPPPSVSSAADSESAASSSPSPTPSTEHSSTASSVDRSSPSAKATSSSDTAEPSTTSRTATSDAATSEVSSVRSDTSGISIVTSTGTIITTVPPPPPTSTDSTASATPTPAVGVPPAAPSDTSGLSTGAKAGIAVGAVAGLLLLLLAIAFVLFKKRKARDEPAQHNTWPMYDRPGPQTSTSQPSVRPALPVRSASQQSRGFWHRGQREGDTGEYDVGVGGSEIPVDMRGQGVGGAAELDGMAVAVVQRDSRPMASQPAAAAAAGAAAAASWQGRQDHHAHTAGPSSQHPWQQGRQNAHMATASQPGWHGQNYPRAAASQHSLYGQRPWPQRYSTVSEAQE